MSEVNPCNRYESLLIIKLTTQFKTDASVEDQVRHLLGPWCKECSFVGCVDTEMLKEPINE